MKIRVSVLLFFFLSVLGDTSDAQENVTTFGMQFKPIFVSDIGGGGAFITSEGPLSVGVMPSTGFAYGMIVRRGLTKNISIESGLNRVQSNYGYLFTDSDTEFERQLNFGIVSYEVPIKAMIFVRMGERLYLNNGLGFSVDIYASDVAVGDIQLEALTLRGAWAKIALEGHVGFEYRTKKAGYFYLGGTYHNPFSPVARSIVFYSTATDLRHMDFFLRGGYLTLDLKYFFNEPPVRK